MAEQELPVGVASLGAGPRLSFDLSVTSRVREGHQALKLLIHHLRLHSAPKDAFKTPGREAAAAPQCRLLPAGRDENEVVERRRCTEVVLRLEGSHPNWSSFRGSGHSDF
jgi:hypothetical protein